MLRRVRWRLRPPPRTLSNLGISRFAPKGPELAGCAVGAVVSAETNSGVEEILAELSLALKSGFPETETVPKQRRGSNVRRLRGEAEHLALTMGVLQWIRVLSEDCVYRHSMRRHLGIGTVPT